MLASVLQILVTKFGFGTPPLDLGPASAIFEPDHALRSTPRTARWSTSHLNPQTQISTSRFIILLVNPPRMQLHTVKIFFMVDPLVLAS